MAALSRSRRLGPAEAAGFRELTSLSGARIRVPASEGITHLQFRRFAGCPVCNLHLRSFARRAADLAAAGISEVVVFHSPREDLVRHANELPFAVIADPAKHLYAEFGVESARRALLDPRAWPAILRSVLHSARAIVREGRPVPPLVPHGGRLGLPADFLIAPDGCVLAVTYGRHANDQWSVDDVLAHAGSSAHVRCAGGPAGAAPWPAAARPGSPR